MWRGRTSRELALLHFVRMKIKCLIKIIYGKWRDAFSVALGREIDDETRDGNKRKTPLSVCFNLESPGGARTTTKLSFLGER